MIRGEWRRAGSDGDGGNTESLKDSLSVVIAHPWNFRHKSLDAVRSSNFDKPFILGQLLNIIWTLASFSKMKWDGRYNLESEKRRGTGLKPWD